MIAGGQVLVRTALGGLQVTCCPASGRSCKPIAWHLSLKPARFWQTPSAVSLTVSWPWPCCVLAIGHVPLPRGSPQSYCLSRALVLVLLLCMFSVADLVRVAHHHHSPCGYSCALLHAPIIMAVSCHGWPEHIVQRWR